MTKKEQTSSESTTVDYKTGLTSSLELSDALVAEIDNIMSSNMPVQATGKVLGEVMTGFLKQINTLKEQYPA